MPAEISAITLRAWLYDGKELALLDVREPGQMILGHILFSAPLPYSRFETGLPRLAPNPLVRMVLCDDGDGVAQRAASRARKLGYVNVSCLAGGVASWAEAGHTLYQGVNVPSKAFGELVEHAVDTPRLSCSTIAEMQRNGNEMVIVDGRPLEEFAKMSIPGARCCPNGELALRAAEFAPNPETTVIVNCAGRTRSIIGAQTLIDTGLPNPVFAMENGTQGWVLAGLSLDSGKQGVLPDKPSDVAQQQSNAASLATTFGVEIFGSDTLRAGLNDPTRTVFLLDVRTAQERSEDTAERSRLLRNLGVVHAPGGQLVQATDQWIGVRNAMIVLLDTEAVRAPVTATWLRRLGHTANVLKGGLDNLSGVKAPQSRPAWQPDLLPQLGPDALQARMHEKPVILLDLRSSEDYRAEHLVDAQWTLRPRLPQLTANTDVVLIAGNETNAALAAMDLREQGLNRVWSLTGTPADWRAQGLPTESTPDVPADSERLDFQSFTAGRHEGDEAASRQYLKWEIELVDQLDADERAVFRV